MIVVYHDNRRVIEAVHKPSNSSLKVANRTIIKELLVLAHNYSNEILVWCHQSQRDNINIEGISKEFRFTNKMMSYAEKTYFSDIIGYVEDSPFVNINYVVCYPTWLMSPEVGAIHAENLIKFESAINLKGNFGYEINSIAKMGMPNGLFCYSNPHIVKDVSKISSCTSSVDELFRFIRQHYRFRWTFLLFFNLLIYDKCFPIIPFLKSLLFKKREVQISISSQFKNAIDKSINRSTIDVIIPTIGRKQYLYDVLKDLANQTLLPKNVIIIEQNPDIGSKSELDYLQNQSWPFLIKHTFTNKTGACNARNLALQQIESDWIFMADDDIRFEKDILENALKEMFKYGVNAATLSCLRKGDKENRICTSQWQTFGTASSIVSRQIAKQLYFDVAYEHGFGEDGDYGMQIRNLGEDIAYLPNCTLIHLKAPIGGFRTKVIQPWQDEQIQPKPSPTIMLFNLKNQTKKQILGYKTLLFIKFFNRQKNKNIFSYFIDMRKRWKRSMYWANKLKNSAS